MKMNIELDNDEIKQLFYGIMKYFMFNNEKSENNIKCLKKIWATSDDFMSDFIKLLNSENSGKKIQLTNNNGDWIINMKDEKTLESEFNDLMNKYLTMENPNGDGALLIKNLFSMTLSIMGGLSKDGTDVKYNSLKNVLLDCFGVN